MSLETFRRARSAEKRAAILAAGLDRFRREGFARATMEQIAADSRVSTATLYRHFASKTALFEAVAAESLDALEAGLPAPGAAPLARLEALAAGYAELLSAPETRGYFRMLAAETGAGGEIAERFYAAIKRRLADVFAEIIGAAREAGAVDCREIEIAAGQLQGMIEHATLLRGLILGDGSGTAAPPEEIAAEAFRTWAARYAR